MVALYNHCTFNLNPRADLDRYAAARIRSARARRSRSRGRSHRHRGERKRRGADPPGFWRRARLLALAAAGVRPRLETRRHGRDASEHQGRGARRPRPVHLGADLEGLLPDDAGDGQSRPPNGSQRTGVGKLSGGARVQALSRGTARCRGQALARHSQAHFGRRAQDRAFHRCAGCARVRQFARSEGPCGAGNVLPGSLPAHQDPPARAAVRSGGAQSRCGHCVARQGSCRLSRRLRGLL